MFEDNNKHEKDLRVNPPSNYQLSQQYVNPYSNTPHNQQLSNYSGNKNEYVTKKSISFALVICILLSTLLGFGGGFLASSSKGRSSGVSISTASESNTTAMTTSDGSSLTVAGVADKVGNSVVEITTETIVTGDFMRQYITNSKGAGSGVIVSADGYIVTNNHVISGANKLTVTLKSGESFSATVVGQDSKEDIALIKIEASGLTLAVFGDSSTLQVGQTAIAVGNPLGQLGGTVTNGIISALNRDITIDGETMNLLQTNAAINPGNSGGGLFNDQGQLIGLVVAKSSGSDIEGLGFAIPSNAVKKVVDELSDHGYVTGRIDMEMSLVDITSPAQAMMYQVSQIGVYVSKVESRSNAESAGFKSGDLIKSIDSNEVKTAKEVNSILDNYSVGDTVKVVVQRGFQETTLSWTLAEDKPNNLQ